MASRVRGGRSREPSVMAGDCKRNGAAPQDCPCKGTCPLPLVAGAALRGGLGAALAHPGGDVLDHLQVVLGGRQGGRGGALVGRVVEAKLLTSASLALVNVFLNSATSFLWSSTIILT